MCLFKTPESLVPSTPTTTPITTEVVAVPSAISTPISTSVPVHSSSSSIKILSSINLPYRHTTCLSGSQSSIPAVPSDPKITSVSLILPLPNRIKPSPSTPTTMNIDQTQEESILKEEKAKLISTTSRSPLSRQNVMDAVRTVIEKRMSIRKASAVFKISKTLIGRYVKKHKETENVEFIYEPHNDIKRVFTDQEEEQLVDYCLKASKFHYGISIEEFLKLVYEYAVLLNKPYPQSWNVNKAAGKTFYQFFIKRHQNLSLRRPEATSLARATAFSKKNVELFFTKYTELLLRFNFTSDRIYNVDESGLSTVHTPMKVLAPKGSKQVGNITSAERGTNVSVIECVNALANSVPPCMIFPRVHFKNHMISGAPPETLGLATPSGWFNSEKFEEFLQHFIKHVKPNNEKKVLLIGQP
jgi:predicted RNA binding protein with dsRBD fold (UPF0201 family)